MDIAVELLIDISRMLFITSSKHLKEKRIFRQVWLYNDDVLKDETDASENQIVENIMYL